MKFIKIKEKALYSTIINLEHIMEISSFKNKNGNDKNSVW